MLARRTLLLALSLAACSRPAPGPAHAPARIVSLSPSTTEALFAIGAGAAVVGRSRYCDYPPEVAHLPVVGGYVDASLETILALTPDLVVGARGPAGRAIADALVARGVATYFPLTESMAEIDAMLVGLGELTGHAADAVAVVARIAAQRAAVARAVAGAPRPRVLFVFGLSPIVVAGPSSFANEMLRLAGGENALLYGRGYPTIALERVLALAPDMVVDAAIAEGHGGTRIHPGDAGWRELAAVREGRVVGLADEAVLRPGPRIGDGIAALARAIHPGLVVP